ncbi:MAG: ABC transporter permease [bacterium]|nr:ABC transporter permease [bacterium]
MLIQNLKTAFSSILSAKLRSFLTMLGIIIGVAAVLLMLAVGEGVKFQVSGQISNLGSNVLTVTSGQVLNSSGNNQRSASFNPSSSLGASTLTEKDLESIKKINDINLVSPIMLVSSLITGGSNVSSTTNIIATTSSYGIIRNLKFANGSFFTEEDNLSGSNVAVIGSTAKKNLFGDKNPIDQEILIRNQPFKIIGLLEESETGTNLGPSFDDAIYIPLNSAVNLTQTKQIFRIIVQVSSANNIDQAKSQIESTLKTNHGGQKDFSVLTQKDLISAFSSILDTLTSFIVAIASISLIVGGIGIMNIMLVSVSERTREIGIRKTVGATFSNILEQFLIEAMVISLIGGFFGLILSVIGGLIIKKVVNITPVYSLRAILIAFSLSVIIGIIFGVAPAIKAARKRPIQALKAL